jgi:hypothetical protein
MDQRKNIVARGDPGTAVKYRIARIGATQYAFKFLPEYGGLLEQAFVIQIPLPEAVDCAWNMPGPRVEGFHFPPVTNRVTRIN